VDGATQVPTLLLAAAGDAFHTQAEVAIYSLFAIFITFERSPKSPVVAVTFNRVEVIPRVGRYCSSGGCLVKRERFLRRSVHALYRSRRLRLMRSLFSTPAALSHDQRLLLGDSHCECSVRSTRKRMLLHWIEDLWNATFCVLKQVPERKSRVVKKSMDFDPFYARVVQNRYTPHTGSDRSDVSSPSPKLFSLQTNETGASGSISRESYPTAIEYRFVNGHKKS